MKHTTAVQDISFSKDCYRILTTAENMIYWQYNSTSNSYVATQIFSDFNPKTVNLAPGEVAVSTEDNG